MLYSEKVMDHFQNPRNVGVIKDADGVGKVGNPVCGDMMEFYIKVKDDVLADVKFRTFGCGAAIAVSSMVSEMATGKTIEEAKKITNDDVAVELGGLPKNKMHCSNLGADALQEAIKDFETNKDKRKEAVGEEPAEDITAETPAEEISMDEEKRTCGTCDIEFIDCKQCGKIRKKGGKCPYCGDEAE
jgi:nitrogen fixation NifU-like protein